MARRGQLLSLIAGRQKGAAQRSDVLLGCLRGVVKSAQAAPGQSYTDWLSQQSSAPVVRPATPPKPQTVTPSPNAPQQTNVDSWSLGGNRLSPQMSADGKSYVGYGDQNANFDRANAIANRTGGGDADPFFNEARSRALAVGADDVAEDQSKAREAEAFRRYAKRHGGYDPMSYDAVRKQIDEEMGPAGFKRDENRKCPEAGSWAQYKQDINDFLDDYDNNVRIQWNSAKHGVGQTLRFAGKWLDPRNWGSSTQARINRMNADSDMETASRLHHERQLRLMKNFNNVDLDLSDPSNNSMIGMLNYGLNSAVGEFTGGELATAGMGTVAKGVGKGVVAGGSKLGNLAQKGVTAATKPVVGTRVSGWAGGAANRMTAGVAKTVASPFTIAGHMSTPITTSGKVVGATGRAAWDTGKAAVRPAGDLLHYLRHPVQSTRAAWQYAAQHPFMAVGRTVAYPARYGWNVAKPGARLAKNVVFNPQAMYGQSMYSAYNNANAGAYGAAAGDVASMGAFEALGPWAVPAYMGYSAMSGGGGQ